MAKKEMKARKRDDEETKEEMKRVEVVGGGCDRRDDKGLLWCADEGNVRGLVRWLMEGSGEDEFLVRVSKQGSKHMVGTPTLFSHFPFPIISLLFFLFFSATEKHVWS